MFPYHYGSYATLMNFKLFGERNGFPYHYGSYATGVGYGTVVRDPQGFHTTMVLTQPT